MSLKIKIFICLFHIGGLLFSQEQTPSLDSIKKQISVINKYLETGHTGEALNLSEKLLEIGERLKSDSLVARANDFFGITFSLVGEQEKSIIYFKKALSTFKKIKDIPNTVETSNNIGVSYGEMKDYTNAEKFYLESLSYAVTDIQKVLPLLNLGYDYARSGFNNKAVEYLNKALIISSLKNDSTRLSVIYEGLFYAHYNLGNYVSAKSFYEKSLKEARVVDELSLFVRVFKVRLEQLKKEKNYKEALDVADSLLKYKRIQKERESLKIYKEIDAKLHIKDNDEKIALIKKEEEIQKLLNVTLTTLLTLLLLFGYVLKQKNSRLKKLNKHLKSANIAIKQSILEKELLEQQIETIQDNIVTDIQDNFGNRLSAITNSSDIFLTLIKSKEFNSEKLKSFKNNLEKSLKNLSEDIKDFIWVNKSKNNSLVLTINKLELYIYNLNNKNVTVDLQTSLFNDEYRLPKYWNRQLFLIVRDAIESSITYSNASYITIEFSIDEFNKLLIVCADNGKNFKREDLLNSPYVFNIKRRAETMGNTITFKPEGEDTISSIVIEGSLPVL